MIPALQKYIEQLRALKAELAEAGLNPNRDEDKTSFGYGKACGIQEGIKRAEKLLDEVLTGQERRDDD